MRLDIQDDFFSDKGLDFLDRMLYNSTFGFSERSVKGAKYGILNSEVDVGWFKKSQAWHELLDHILTLNPGKLYRVNINAQVFGDQTYYHSDSPKDGLTALIYLVKDTWDKDWGGETIYYENEEPTRLVLPKRNRVTFADPRIPHVGRSPNKICPEVRYTLAVKCVIE